MTNFAPQKFQHSMVVNYCTKTEVGKISTYITCSLFLNAVKLLMVVNMSSFSRMREDRQMQTFN